MSLAAPPAGLLPVHVVTIGVGAYNKIETFRIITASLQVVITQDLEDLSEG